MFGIGRSILLRGIYKNIGLNGMSIIIWISTLSRPDDKDNNFIRDANAFWNDVIYLQFIN